MKKELKTSERNGKHIIFIIMFAVLVAVIGVLSAFLIIKRSSSAESDTSSSSLTSTTTVKATETQKSITGKNDTTTTTKKETTEKKDSTTKTKKETTEKETPATETTLEETTAEQKEPTTEITYINGILIVNKTYALPQTYNPGDILPEAQDAFERMANDAADEGISLYIVSGFRSYDYQASLYERYAARDGYEAADRYSARPGYSEHQSGLGMDINSTDQSFAKTEEGKWLAANCSKYGFIIRYPKGKEKQTGYMYEPWHIRYLGIETATAVTESGLCLEEYLGITSKYKD